MASEQQDGRGPRGGRGCRDDGWVQVELEAEAVAALVVGPRSPLLASAAGREDAHIKSLTPNGLNKKWAMLPAGKKVKIWQTILIFIYLYLSLTLLSLRY